jgi:bifunctional N-acetylglucosamine-1-phosphate-uridyltransferase/glucosamine-1-phosphate-acetyltransferase GlmU-like protein
VEFRDANDEEREISKVNAGIYLARTQAMLKYLPMLNTNNDQKEYYLTDLVEIMHGKGLKVGYSICSDPTEVAGVNSMAELKALEKKMFHQDKEVLECAG